MLKSVVAATFAAQQLQAHRTAGDAFRLPGSPYPRPLGGPNSTCSPSVLGIGESLSSSQRVTLQSLQGGIARDCVALFRTGSDAGLADQWLADLQSKWDVTVDLSKQDDFSGTVKALASHVGGYVTYSSSNADSVNVALSYCAALTESGDNVVVAVELGDVDVFTAAAGPVPLVKVCRQRCSD